MINLKRRPLGKGSKLTVKQMMRVACVLLAAIVATSNNALAAEPVDLLIRNALIFDGSGGMPVRADLAVDQGRVVAIGEAIDLVAKRTLDVDGLAVAPGFINVLSWATDSLWHDGRAMSDLKQGVTLEIFGEGTSLGPVNDELREELIKAQTEIRYDITWSTLGEYLDTLVARGISPNVASFVGATTVRVHELGYANRKASKSELQRMQQLVRSAMREGALGVGSALIYAPGAYADTDELIALARAAGEIDGVYISHLRSEGDRLLEALDELIRIAREAKVAAEVYHLKAAGEGNWPKMAQVIARIEQARKAGVRVSANMYPYTAGASGLDAAMPPWVQEGGVDEWIARLQDPETRERVIKEMREPSEQWESLYLAAGSAERVRLRGFRNEKLKPLIGMSLAEVARDRKVTPEDAAIDLVIEDRSRVAVAYDLMSEANVLLGLSQPWISIGSDAAAPATEGVFLQSNPHPRAYGSFARFLGHYVREQRASELSSAIRRLTRLPAETFKLKHRGCLSIRCHADIVVFDPATISDRATFDQPHRYAEGVVHVFVNGVQVLANGEHTGAKPGQVVRGPGWEGWEKEAESSSDR